MTIARLYVKWRALLVFGILAGTLWSASPSLFASDDNEIDVAQAEAIRITLERQVGKRVLVKLAGGGEVEGVAKKVGPTAVHLSELSGKEFFDAVVRLDQVSAVIVRVKTK